MEYGVRYDILIGNKTALAKLTSFNKAVNRTVPIVTKKLSKIPASFVAITKSIQASTAKLSSTFAAPIKTTGLNKVILRTNMLNSSLVRAISLMKTLNGLQGTGVIGATSAGTRGVVGRARGAIPAPIPKPKAGKILSKKSAVPRGLGKTFKGTSALSAMRIPFATTLGAGGIGLALYGIIKQGAQFEVTMTNAFNILRTNSSLTSEQFQSDFGLMSKEMRQLGIDTQYSANQIADATKFLARAGLSVSDIRDIMPSITDIATIGDEDLGRVADVVTNIVTAFKIPAIQAAAAADVLAKATNQSNTDIMSMAEAMKFAAAPAAMAGLSFHETAAMIGLLGDAGVQGTRAGTAFRATVLRLVAPSKQASKVIQGLRDSTTGAAISFTKLDEKGKVVLKPLAETFKQLKDSKATMAQIKRIFEKIGLSSVLEGVGGLDKLIKKTESLYQAGGYAHYLAEEKMKTLFGKWKKFTSRIGDIGLDMFSKMQPALKLILDNLSKFLDDKKVKSGFIKLGVWISSAFSAIGEVVTHLRPVLFEFGNVISSFLEALGVRKQTVLEGVLGLIDSIGASLKWIGDFIGANPTLVKLGVIWFLTFSKVVPVIMAIRKAVIAFNIVSWLNPWFIIPGLIIGAIASTMVLWDRFAAFRGSVNAFWATSKWQVKELGTMFYNWMEPVAGLFRTIAELVGQIISADWGGVKNTLTKGAWNFKRQKPLSDLTRVQNEAYKRGADSKFKFGEQIMGIFEATPKYKWDTSATDKDKSWKSGQPWKPIGVKDIIKTPFSLLRPKEDGVDGYIKKPTGIVETGVDAPDVTRATEEGLFRSLGMNPDGSPLSGAGEMMGVRGGKKLEVSIGSLVENFNVTIESVEDFDEEEFKERIAKSLVSAIRDFEISYT